MLILSYFYSVAFCGFIGAFFKTNSGVNMFMKALSLLAVVVGVATSEAIINTETPGTINHIVVILAGVLGITFTFAKGSGSWSILVKLLCLLALISAGIYFSF